MDEKREYLDENEIFDELFAVFDEGIKMSKKVVIEENKDKPSLADMVVKETLRSVLMEVKSRTQMRSNLRAMVVTTIDNVVEERRKRSRIQRAMKKRDGWLLRKTALDVINGLINGMPYKVDRLDKVEEEYSLTGTNLKTKRKVNQVDGPEPKFACLGFDRFVLNSNLVDWTNRKFVVVG